jgi:hypothetical protein
MKSFNIQPFVTLSEISSASGLTYSDGVIRIISDDSNYLYEFDTSQNRLSKILLLDGVKTEQIIKSEKLDLESLTETEDAIFTFGSGSTPKRETGFSINKKTHNIETINLHHLYNSMRTIAKIDVEDFNIEGVTHDGKDFLFLNRGNGPKNRNVVIRVQGKSLETDFHLLATEYELPKIAGMPSGFSDATIVDHQLYFIATAEAGTSTYLDGEVAGSLIGSIHLDTMKIDYTEQISHHQKFEGIAFLQKNENKISFLLCEDNDDQISDCTLFQIELNLQ